MAFFLKKNSNFEQYLGLALTSKNISNKEYIYMCVFLAAGYPWTIFSGWEWYLNCPSVFAYVRFVYTIHKRAPWFTQITFSAIYKQMIVDREKQCVLLPETDRSALHSPGQKLNNLQNAQPSPRCASYSGMQIIFPRKMQDLSDRLAAESINECLIQETKSVEKDASQPFPVYLLRVDGQSQPERQPTHPGLRRHSCPTCCWRLQSISGNSIHTSLTVDGRRFMIYT